MSEPEGWNNPSDVPTDSASAPPSEPGPSTSAVQAPGAQAPLPTGVAPQASAAQPGKTVLGLRQDTNHYRPPQNVVFADDYEKRLPEDPYGEETAPNARIWRVYNEEAAAYDAVFVGQARDGLDVMLVFAGLFSAVVTSFLVQVSQSLQADYTAMSAILLYDLVSVQLSMTDGSSSRPNITAPSINPLQTFRPDSITVWVNGLWVVSLAMSLVVALSAVLVKQWFHHYTSIPSGTPAARSHLRQYRFDGLQKWRVNIIVGLFPIIMHTSLVLFLVGLILFFIPLRTSLACTVGVITVVLCLLYLVSGALPVFFPQCPYQTPLTDFVFYTCLVIRNARDSIPSLTRRLAYDMLLVCRHWLLDYLHLHTPDIMFDRVRPERTEHSESSRTLNQLETFTVESNYGKVSVDALDWLFYNSSNPTVHSLVGQAIGGLPPDVQEYAQVTCYERREIRDMFEYWFYLGNSIECDSVRERLLRSAYLYLGYPSFLCQMHILEYDEPRFTATTWAATTGDLFRRSRGVRKFFCTYNQLKLHPFVWKGLVRPALDSDSPCFQVGSLQDLSNPNYAYIITLFLPASNSPNESNKVSNQCSTGHSCAVTLHDALTLYLGNISESVQHRLLDMLLSFKDDLPATMPLHYRILYKAGQFALCYLPNNFWASYRDDGGSCRHWELLAHVLQSFYVDFETILVEHSCLVGPILELLCAIVDDTSFCDYLAAHLQEPKLHALLYNSISVISHLLQRMAFSRQPGFVFPTFHRLLQHDLFQDQHPETVRKTLNLMETALKIGNEEMYRAFIDREWLWSLAEIHIADQGYTDVEPIPAFICGSQALDPASALEFLDYLQQPRNFTVVLLVIASQFDSEPLLLKLCPKDSSLWHTNRPILDGLIDWCQASNRTGLMYPLENFFNGKVVQTDDGASVCLDEALRTWFTTEDHYRRKVAWCARTIILGEAAPDIPQYP